MNTFGSDRDFIATVSEVVFQFHHPARLRAVAVSQPVRQTHSSQSFKSA